MSTSAGCDTCGKNPTPSVPLKNCAKCHSRRYCSRDCQKTDWKQHKKVCSARASQNSRGSTSHMGNPGNDASGDTNVKQEYVIDKPFHGLENNTWLHNRPEPRVYELLIDAYRLRVEDEYKFHGDINNDSLYSTGNKAGALRGFRKFIHKAESCKPPILPPWWADEKSQACLEYAQNAKGDHDLGGCVEKSDIQEFYGVNNMPMQLRMLAEKIEGTGIGGQSGAPMRQMLMATEAGREPRYSSMIDISGFR